MKLRIIQSVLILFAVVNGAFTKLDAADRRVGEVTNRTSMKGPDKDAFAQTVVQLDLLKPQS